MSAADAGYNPLSYHNGTVWPHDNSLIAWGWPATRAGQEAQRIFRRMLNASGHFDHQLPEVFAGLPRAETPFPIAYPTAARPQAWAAGHRAPAPAAARPPAGPAAAPVAVGRLGDAADVGGLPHLRDQGVQRVWDVRVDDR